MTVLASLLLADSRLPTGGHAHSGGVEAAVERGLLRDEADLALFLAGRLRGTGPVLAAVAAVGCLLAAGTAPSDTMPVDWGWWDSAVSARIPSAAAREASRAQGAALLRTARRVWPSAAFEALFLAGRRPHHPLVLGAAVAATGDGADAAALLTLHHLLGGACAAAVRLLGLDPITVAAVQARASRPAEQAALTAVQIAREAVAQRDPRLLPSTGTPLPEVLAELHARTEVTLFAS
ncbi:MAG: urease accessory protein UreF [Pseudonocardiaceae bacterium]